MYMYIYIIYDGLCKIQVVFSFMFFLATNPYSGELQRLSEANLQWKIEYDI